MKQRFWLTRLAVVSLAVLLSACASQGEFRPEGGATGNLGDQNPEEPRPMSTWRWESFICVRASLG